MGFGRAILLFWVLWGLFRHLKACVHLSLNMPLRKIEDSASSVILDQGALCGASLFDKELREF